MQTTESAVRLLFWVKAYRGAIFALAAIVVAAGGGGLYALVRDLVRHEEQTLGEALAGSRSGGLLEMPLWVVLLTAAAAAAGLWLLAVKRWDKLERLGRARRVVDDRRGR